jgi:hypothetical protein
VRVAVLSGTGAIVNGNFATGERGSVRLSTVPAGRWELLVSASGSAVTQVAVQAPGPVVPIALSPGTRLSIHVPELAASAQIGTVRIVGSNSQPFRSLGWSGQPQTSWPLRGGRIEIGSLPPGIWTVSVDTYDGARWGGTITTSPTATASLTLDGNGR